MLKDEINKFRNLRKRFRVDNFLNFCVYSLTNIIFSIT